VVTPVPEAGPQLPRHRVPRGGGVPRPSSCLVTYKDRHHHRQTQRRLVIADHDERLRQQWREQFSGDVRDKEDLYAAHRKKRRANRRCHWAFAEEEIDNPNLTLDEEDPRWDDLWTAPTSDEE
jgi:hypothetical protein